MTSVDVFIGTIGVMAGVSCAFCAPMGGLLFVFEEIASFLGSRYATKPHSRPIKPPHPNHLNHSTHHPHTRTPHLV